MPILPRRSAFRRKAAGSRPWAQTIAANVDTLFIATSINGDLNPRRLERYVAMGRESGADPVLILTKSDLAGGLRRDRRASGSRPARAGGRHQRHGPARASNSSASWFVAGKTLALVGSSGVGKSTLLNRLAGEELMITKEIREDDSRGRHTTTHRELFLLAGGALVLDTPGMRELGLWDAAEGVDETFEDIIELALQCRFADCTHRFEPGCAILREVSEGRLDASRVKGYRRLAVELAEQPTSLAVKRERERRFSKAIRNVSAEKMARKTYRDGPY